MGDARRWKPVVPHRGVLCLDRVGGNGSDEVAFDQVTGVLDSGLVHPVEDVDVGGKRLRRGILRSCRSDLHRKKQCANT